MSYSLQALIESEDVPRRSTLLNEVLLLSIGADCLQQEWYKVGASFPTDAANIYFHHHCSNNTARRTAQPGHLQYSFNSHTIVAFLLISRGCSTSSYVFYDAVLYISKTNSCILLFIRYSIIWGLDLNLSPVKGRNCFTHSVFM